MTVLCFWLAIVLTILCIYAAGKGWPELAQKMIVLLGAVCVVVFLFGVSEWMWEVMP